MATAELPLAVTPARVDSGEAPTTAPVPGTRSHRRQPRRERTRKERRTRRTWIVWLVLVVVVAAVVGWFVLGNDDDSTATDQAYIASISVA